MLFKPVYTCEMKLLLLLLIASYVVYKSFSSQLQEPAKIGGLEEPLKPPLVTGLNAANY